MGLSKENVEYQTKEQFQIAISHFTGEFIYNLLMDKRISILQSVPFSLHPVISRHPIPNVLTLYADGNQTQPGRKPQDGKRSLPAPTLSPQHSELAAVLLALQTFLQTSFNLLTDSFYLVNIVQQLPDSILNASIDKPLLSLFVSAQTLLTKQQHPFFIAYIRGYPQFPRALIFGNQQADSSFCFIGSLFTEAFQSHQFFHQGAKALR